ncbi:hypothetical protein B566_EDAN011021 [Ephemera danica]|nr:hypothetical protein B566_EDAN011021 [Ephemera danica]
MEKVLKKLYYDPSHVAGFGTVNKLWLATGKKFDKGKIAEWLRAQDAHTLHRPRRTRFQRSRYFVPDMNNLFQADLCDMRSLEKFNKGVMYILTVIDVFCKKAWAVSLKDKRASTIIQAFRSIFKIRKPRFLQTDKGKEFVAKDVQKYLKSENIKFYTTNNPDVKASVVERFNRTLKTKMWKYFTHANTHKYCKICCMHITIPNTLQSIWLPTRLHYRTRMKYGQIKKKKPVFKVGDKVRITREKYTFEKGYETNWSTEIFVVSKQLDIRFLFVRNKLEVCLTKAAATALPRIVILDATLWIRKVRINPGILIAHAKSLSLHTAKYPYKRVEMHNYTIPMGSQHHTIENMFLGRIPCRVIIGLVSHAAFSGSFSKNPFNFQHFNVNYLTLFKNGEQMFSRPYSPVYGDDASYAMPYLQSFINTGNHLADDGYCVSLKDWQNGFCLYPFDLTPDLSAHEQHWCIQEQGNLRLEIGTKTPFAEAVTIIVYAEFREVLEIDKNRDISIEMARGS